MSTNATDRLGALERAVRDLIAWRAVGCYGLRIVTQADLQHLVVVALDAEKITRSRARELLATTDAHLQDIIEAYREIRSET